MQRYLINVALIVGYFVSVLVIAAAHYAVSQAIRPTPDGAPGPIAGATLFGLLLVAAWPFVMLWRRAPIEQDVDQDTDVDPGADHA